MRKKLLLWLPSLLPESILLPSEIINIEVWEYGIMILHLKNQGAVYFMSFSTAENAKLFIVCVKWSLLTFMQ